MAKIKKRGSVYLLHFSKPYKGARHYMGFSSDVAARIAAHKSGQGSPLVRAVVKRGIGVRLVRVWRNATRTIERSMKNRAHNAAYCPVCNR